MRLITFALLLIYSTISFGQDCEFLPADTTVCGFKHVFQMSDEDGTFYFECEEDKLIAISTDSNGVAIFSFTACGEYEVVFESEIENCLDTFRIEVRDPSNSVTQLNTAIGLGYGSFDCPDGAVADCFSDFVSISIPSGPPIEVWDFCTTATCQTITYNTQPEGDIDGCLVDTISCSTIVISDSAEDCVETNQDAFIILNSNGDMVDNNTFLEYLASLQASIGLDCPPILNACDTEFDTSCYDTTIMDTTYLHIPVRLGGRWTLVNIDDVVLYDTTYFEHMGNDYELILDPGVTFYGPGNLNIYLYQLDISSSDTLRSFPYGFDLELQWEEDWIIDTLQLIKEIPVDTTGDCYTCGGNFFNSSFNVPGIPDFPCGPISISYPDECECETQYFSYNIEMQNCGNCALVTITSSIPEAYVITSSSGDGYFINHGNDYTAFICAYGSENIDVYIQDFNGCEYVIPVELELEKYFGIFAYGSVLSCDNPSIELTAQLIDYNSNEVTFDSEPTFFLPNGEMFTGTSYTATEEGQYRLVYIDDFGCVYEDELMVTYDDETYIYYETVVMCGEESVEHNGQIISEAGTYTFDIDCNESTQLTVEQYDFQESFEAYTVCDGEEVVVHGNTLFAGSHLVEVYNGSPCPDIVHVEVQEINLNFTLDATQNCDGTGSLLFSHDSDGAEYAVFYGDEEVNYYTSEGNTFELEVTNSGSYIVAMESSGCISIEEVFIDLVYYDMEQHEDIVLTCDEICQTIYPEIINHNGEVFTNEYTLNWTGPNGFSSTEDIIQVCGEGNYTLSLFYGDACVVSQNILVEEDFEPDVQFIQADLCYGECYDDGTYSFCQSTQTTIEVDECNRIEVDITIAEEITELESFTLCEGEQLTVNNSIYDEDGVYTEIITAISGCDSTLTFTVDVLERGEITSDNIIDCKHEEAVLMYDAKQSNETYIWRDQNGNVVSNAAEYVATEAGLYTLEVTATGVQSSCTFTEEFELLEHKVIPEITLHDSYTINCEASIDLSLGLEEGSNWVWLTPDGTSVENVDFSADIAGIYTVTVTNVEGCSTEKTIDIIQAETIELEYATEPTCEGVDEGLLSIQKLEGGVGPYTIFLNEEEVGMSIKNLEAGYYLLQIYQSDGCIYEKEVTIEAIPDLEEMPVQQLEYCNNNGVTVFLDLDETISFEWLDGYESAERQIRQEGVYEVAFSNGCNSVIGTYQVEDTRVEENYAVSNIFSPNGHAINQRMKVVPQVEYDEFKLYIFSRDGSLVYHSTNPEEGWDGKIGGSNVVIGSYVWMIESTIYTCEGDLEKAQDIGTVMVLY